MRFKVELSSDVQRFLQTCTAEERSEFRKVLVILGDNPVRSSSRHEDPTISRFSLRTLTLGGIRVVFGFNRLGTTVKVRQCRRVPRAEGHPGNEGP